MPNLHARTLARAASIVGGVDVLAQHLAVPAETLGRYMKGEIAVPIEVFLRATEILTEASIGDARVVQPELKPSG
jgi:hypothetical protein